MPNIPITNGLIAYYDYNSFINNIWYDYTENKNNATKISGTIKVNKGDKSINGTTLSSIVFPDGIIPENYTLINLSKYNNTQNGMGRILQCYDKNFAAGFYGGLNGIFFNGKEWLSQKEYSNFFTNEWVLSVMTPNMCRSNQINLTTISQKSKSKSKSELESESELDEGNLTLSINKSNVVSSKENSNWGCSLILIYNKELSLSEINKLENYVIKTEYNGVLRLFDTKNIKIPEDLPVKTGLKAYYDQSSFFGGKWYSYTGDNNAELISGALSKNGNFITGMPSSKIAFPNGILGLNYSLIYLAKFTNSSIKRRIIEGNIQTIEGFKGRKTIQTKKVNTNLNKNVWVSGFTNGNAGVAYHGQWITPSKTEFGSTMDWILSVDTLNSYRANRKTLTLNGLNKKNSKSPFSVSIGGSSESSGWEIPIILIYDRTLTDFEILQLEDWITMYKYQGYVKETLHQLNYRCLPSNQYAYLGRSGQNYNEYEYASYNGNDIMSCSQENNIAKPNFNNVVCTSWESVPIESEPSLCNKAFEYYHLYNTDNPLVVKGRDIDYSMKNTITNYEELYDLANANPNSFASTNTASQMALSVNQLISQTPLKMACCLRKKGDTGTQNIKVRVPLSPNVASENTMLKKMDFQNDTMQIPLNQCPVNMYNGSEECDTFYDVYCKNVANYYKQQGLDPNDFVNFAPECACYAPTKGTKNYAVPSGIPAKCYKEGCSVDNESAYIDPSSRTGQCNLTVCSSLVNLSGLKAGGNVSVNPVVENNCGPGAVETEQTEDQAGKNDPDVYGTNGIVTESSNLINSTTGLDNDTTTNLYILIAVIIVLLLLIGGGVYLFLSGKSHKSRHHKDHYHRDHHHHHHEKKYVKNQKNENNLENITEYYNI